MKIPKSIKNHPAVEEVDYGPDVAIDDYKYSVFLKEGWRFSSGRMEGGRMGNFNTVKEFLFAEPKMAEGK